MVWTLHPLTTPTTPAGVNWAPQHLRPTQTRWLQRSNAHQHGIRWTPCLTARISRHSHHHPPDPSSTRCRHSSGNLVWFPSSLSLHHPILPPPPPRAASLSPPFPPAHRAHRLRPLRRPGESPPVSAAGQWPAPIARRERSRRAGASPRSTSIGRRGLPIPARDTLDGRLFGGRIGIGIGITEGGNLAAKGKHGPESEGGKRLISPSSTASACSPAGARKRQRNRRRLVQ